MAIYGTILREDSSSRRESIDMECVSLIPLPTCLFPSLLYPTFLRPRLVDAMRAAYPFSLPLSFSQPLRKFESAREKVNDPSGDFQRSGDWNHRWDSSRLNSPVCRWYIKKKKEKNFESTDLGLRARWGSRLVSAWFDPWKWLSGIELSIDEDLMLAGRIDFSLPLFLLSTLRKYTCTRGRGEEGLFLLCPANEKLGNNPRVAGEIFNSILCSNLGSLTERRYIKGEIYAEVFSDGKPVFFTA